MDADGRTTFNGYLSEYAIDRVYSPTQGSGINAVMALGIIAAFNFVAQDAALTSYLNGTLIHERRLHKVAEDKMALNTGTYTNYSGYNMAFQGMWLALRYITDTEARASLQYTLDKMIYTDKSGTRMPIDNKQTLFDFIYAAGMANSTAFNTMSKSIDFAAVQRGIETLYAFHQPPYWGYSQINCDENEIKSKLCVATDGTTIVLLGEVGWNSSLVAASTVPMDIRPASNYHWRSNPYAVNGESSPSVLLSGVDFRYAYWLGRWSN
jgi:hypothetical protein